MYCPAVVVFGPADAPSVECRSSPSSFPLIALYFRLYQRLRLCRISRHLEMFVFRYLARMSPSTTRARLLPFPVSSTFPSQYLRSLIWSESSGLPTAGGLIIAEGLPLWSFQTASLVCAPAETSLSLREPKGHPDPSAPTSPIRLYTSLSLVQDRQQLWTGRAWSPWLVQLQSGRLTQRHGRKSHLLPILLGRRIGSGLSFVWSFSRWLENDIVPSK